ncbi:MAG TPA: DnaA/Hda family protein [Ktedonobacterales bacterium]
MGTVSVTPHQTPSQRLVEPTIPRCPVCHDTGWVRYDVQPSDTRFGQAFRCPCQREADANRRAERARDASDAAPEREGCTFSTYEARYNAGALQAVAAWATGYVGWGCRIPGWSPWLFLHGGYGSGKTHLLGAAFYTLLDAGYAPIYSVSPLLLDHIRDGITAGDYSERFYAVRDCPILLLDDLGAEASTPWAQEAMFKLIDYRYRLGRPLAVASNLSPDELEPRIGSRLRDRKLSVTIQMVGPDWRTH